MIKISYYWESALRKKGAASLLQMNQLMQPQLSVCAVVCCTVEPCGLRLVFCPLLSPISLLCPQVGMQAKTPEVSDRSEALIRINIFKNKVC